MKIRPVILCGGSGTRLWPNLKKHQAKQFIDFGGWTLFGKALERIKGSLFDTPIISTNIKFLKEVQKHLKKNKIKKYKIVLEPFKKNTGPAILTTALIKDIPENQPIIFLTADHLIEEVNKFNKIKLRKNLSANKLIGVQEINSYLNNNIDLKQCKELINIKTRQYAKRQNTWARGHMKNWNKVYSKDFSHLLKKTLKVVS